ncbi:MAG: 2-oxoglutarate ferredoxin oxidoreductase subunit alpha [Psychromonas sp.]|jgi:2-oxoglutarate ferredoxin oxidoreductase subunit alpha|uniref:2-oxoacid:acceptor oxidoreductase subunit alpha n=1 Tax=Psychromonas sp. TaxID=1884585 RepID=UPI0039E58CCC
METEDISLVITGPGGAGVIAAGELLLKTAAQLGYYGLLKKSFGPQIRGGESSAMLRLSSKRVECLQDAVQLLLVIDWHILTPFIEELVFNENTLIICDQESGEIPQAIIDSHATLCPVPLTLLSKQMKTKVNMIGVGLLANLLGLPLTNLLAVTKEHFQGKEAALIESVIIGIETGNEYALSVAFPALSNLGSPRKNYWLYTGNQLIGLAALKAGIRFVAGYPITPATDLLEWMAVNIDKVGGTLVQAEDELASINMIIGASYGGVPALTATSGPGLSLMSEGLGLAIASEIPLLVVNVNRGGPSTGIPTKSEQSDLNQALFGMHGDAPHLVTAPIGIADCAFTTGWTVNLAERLQCPAILLSDQFIGHSIIAGDKPLFYQHTAQRETAEPDGDYLRYLNTKSGISPMAIPGTANGMYTADGLTHNEQGHPSALANVQQQQLDKRQRKLLRYDYGEYWGQIDNQGDVKIICFGSLHAIILDALTLLTQKGIAASLITLRLLAPLPIEQLQECLSGATHIIVIEQSHGGQLFHYLASHLFKLAEFSAASYSLAKPGPVPFSSAEVADFVEQTARLNKQGEKVND